MYKPDDVLVDMLSGNEVVVITEAQGEEPSPTYLVLDTATGCFVEVTEYQLKSIGEVIDNILLGVS